MREPYILYSHCSIIALKKTLRKKKKISRSQKMLLTLPSEAHNIKKNGAYPVSQAGVKVKHCLTTPMSTYGSYTLRIRFTSDVAKVAKLVTRKGSWKLLQKRESLV